MNKEKTELKEMSVEQLHEKVEQLRQELFGLKFNAKTTHIINYSKFGKIKKNIARALTYLNQKTKEHK